MNFTFHKLWTKGSRTYTLVFGAVLLLLAVIFFYQLGNRPLLDYDESIYAQVAREALSTNQLTTFHWLGNIGLDRPGLWAEKPPLMLWLIQTGYLVFGVNELGARIWVGLFALATIVLTFFVTKKLFNSAGAGLLAISLYFVSYQYIEAAGTLQFDIPVGFFILLSLYLFYLGLSNPKYYYGFGVSLALGMLTKNVVGLMPVLIIGLYSILTLNFSYFKSKKFWIGVLISLAIILPWHIIESIKVGQPFWDQYLFYHVLKRYNQPLEGNSGDFWYFWNLIKESRVLFWSSLAGFGYFLIQSLRRKKDYLFVLLAGIVIFLFFSTAKTKLPAYILILYPFLVIMAGVFLHSILRKVFKPDTAFYKTAIVLIVVVAGYLGFRFNDYKLLKQQEQYNVDSRAVGLFLKDEQTDLPVYYSSTIGTKPSIIFYSNRVVNFLRYPSPKPAENFLLISEIVPDYPEAKLIFTTSEINVYELITSSPD